MPVPKATTLALLLALAGCSAPFAAGEGPTKVELLAARVEPDVWLDGISERRVKVLVAFLSGPGDLIEPDPSWTTDVWTVLSFDVPGDQWASRERGFAPLAESTRSGGGTGYRVRARVLDGPSGPRVEVEARCVRERETVLHATATIELPAAGDRALVLPLERVAP